MQARKFLAKEKKKIAEMQSSSLLYVSEAGKGLPVVSGALAQAAPISGTAQRIPPYLGRQLTSKRARMRPRWIAPLESTGCFYGGFFFLLLFVSVTLSPLFPVVSLIPVSTLTLGP
jgi:hypothetical protein